MGKFGVGQQHSKRKSHIFFSFVVLQPEPGSCKFYCPFAHLPTILAACGTTANRQQTVRYIHTYSSTVLGFFLIFIFLLVLRASRAGKSDRGGWCIVRCIVECKQSTK